MNESPAAVPSTPPKRRRRIPKKLIALGVALALAGGGWWYVQAPDLPPGGPFALLPNLRALTANLPIVGTRGPINDPVPESQALLDASLASLNNTPEAKTEAAIRQALTSTGLPITTVEVTTTPGGASTLVVGLDSSKLLKGGAFDPGLTGGVEALVALVKTKGLDLSATEHVVIAVADGESRPLFGIAAPSSAIVASRDGKLSQQDFLKTVAIKAESRAALLDAARALAGR